VEEKRFALSERSEFANRPELRLNAT
jgi:hypothetical protein